MKKIIISFFLLLTAGLSVSIASETFNPSQRVLDEFKKEFSSAQSVSWGQEEGYEKATFVLGGRRVIAWFSESGQLEGSIRDIFFDQLPLTVMTAVDKRFAEADIFSVSEINNTEGTFYRIILAIKDKKYKVKVDPAGNLNDIAKLPK